MGSTRLPGKVLMDLSGQPALAWAIRRSGRAATLDEVIVATTTKPHDDPIVELCNSLGVRCFRGSEDDVLDRYYHAARGADAVVRLTGDDPLIDPEVIDRVVECFVANQPTAAYVSNVHPVRTYPRGQDTEVIRMDALERAWMDDHDPRLREHVTPYIVHHPELFPSMCVKHKRDLSHMRWALDTPEDLGFLREVCTHLRGDTQRWEEIVSLIERNPAWSEINSGVVQKPIQSTASLSA